MPTATSPPNFLLRYPTTDELTYIRTLHASCWAGPLTVPQYLSREAHIASTSLTRDGGLTQWVLVESTSEQVLASCETIKKIAAMSCPRTAGEKAAPVKEVVAHGIGCVFTPPECRGRGYARIMLTLLGERLKYHDDEVAGFSALYSDIGKVGFPAPSTSCFRFYGKTTMSIMYILTRLHSTGILHQTRLASPPFLSHQYPCPLYRGYLHQRHSPCRTALPRRYPSPLRP